MQHFLDNFQLYQDKIITVLTWVGSLGVIDVLLRRVPTEKPKSILILIQTVCRGIDKVIDSIPGMKQTLKLEDKKETK